jgi:hypothetical protein
MPKTPWSLSASDSPGWMQRDPSPKVSASRCAAGTTSGTGIRPPPEIPSRGTGTCAVVTAAGAGTANAVAMRSSRRMMIPPVRARATLRSAQLCVSTGLLRMPQRLKGHHLDATHPRDNEIGRSGRLAPPKKQAHLLGPPPIPSAPREISMAAPVGCSVRFGLSCTSAVIPQGSGQVLQSIPTL